MRLDPVILEGTVEEGTLRHHMHYPDGRVRDSVYFSVIAPDWPAVKDHLERLRASYA